MSARTKPPAAKPPAAKPPIVEKRRRKPSLTRSLQQALQLGRHVAACKIGPDGTIVLQFRDSPDDSHPPTNPSEWDEVL
jgi:hypothetical protein